MAVAAVVTDIAEVMPGFALRHCRALFRGIADVAVVLQGIAGRCRVLLG